MDVSQFVRKRLKFRHLRVLLALDETLNVSRAAENLNIAQASVSRTLAEIEDGFGLTLFHRHPRGLRRTGPGNELIRASRMVVNNILALEDIGERFNALSTGHISIGLHNHSVLGQVAALLSDFKRRYPRVAIKVRDGLLPDLLADLEYGRLDIVIGRLGQELEQTSFGIHALAQTQMVIVAHTDVAPPSPDPETLLAHPWTIPLPGTPMRLDFDRFCAEHGVGVPQDCIETNNATLITELLIRDKRYGLFPAVVTGEGPMPPLLQAHPVLTSYSYPFKARNDRIGMVHATSNPQSPAAAALIDMVCHTAFPTGGVM